MMTRDDINNEYFEWLCKLIGEDRHAEQISFKKLLMSLHGTPFRYIITKDKNRAEDGLDLRWQFIQERYSDSYYNQELLVTDINGPCSVFEMMVALARRCENTIMDDPVYGDRTGQWFWGMITTLGLGSMIDFNFDRLKVETIIERFLNREYEPNGRGGLFLVRNCDRDVRELEIWHQLCWYLDSIT